jgi:hypothetical protein
MKKIICLLAPLAAAALAATACTSSVEEDAESDESEIKVTATTLDDAVATTILKDGCELEGLGTTKGTGGKCPTKLSAIMDLLGDAAQVFVVSEKGDLPKDADTTYRFVVSAGTEKAPLWVATVGNKNLSEGGAEAIGWSPKRKAFAYYKVEGTKWVRKGDGGEVKSMTKGTERPFECITCHSTGAPLMKELHDSWGNWTSTWFSVQQPEGGNALFKRMFEKVQRADDLEVGIVSAMHLHSKGRVDRAKKDKALKGVLTQLMCEVGEPSLIGAHSANSDRLGAVSTFSSMLPTAILTNQLLVAPRTGGTGVELGLEQTLGLEVPSLGSLGQGIDSTAYSKAVKDNAQKIGGKAGDAIFPMSSPEKSYADLDAVQELLRQKLIDNEIVADILMTDFTVSSFSKIRCDLAETMPQTWKTPAELKTEWAKALEGSKLRGAKGLRTRLGKDDLADHAKKLETFAKACTTRPAPDFTKDMLTIISQRRVEFAARYSDVIESPWLIPTDKLASKAGAVRLNATKCTIEAGTTKFVGED